MPPTDENERYAVIFDCDGVLLDSEPLGLESLYQACVAAGFPYTRDELTRFCGITDHESFLIMCRESGVEVDESSFLTMKRELYLALLEERGVKVFEGVLDFLIDLRSWNFRTAVATSAPRKKLMAGLSRTNLLPYFDSISTGDEVRHGKPKPDIFLLASRRLGVRPERCFVVEDTPVGVRAGLAAGMNVIAVTNTFPAQHFSALDCVVVPSLRTLSARRLMDALPGPVSSSNPPAMP